jgi:hypothetical protein
MPAPAPQPNFPATKPVPDAIQTRTRHHIAMSQYIIVPAGDGSGFNIAVAGSDGARHTMLGFATEEEAEAWIALDKRLDGANDISVAYQPIIDADSTI